MPKDLLAPLSEDEKAEMLLSEPMSEEEKASVLPESSAMEKVETGLRSGVEGLTLGALEPLFSGSNALDVTIQQAIAEGSFDPVSMQNFLNNYNADIERRRLLKTQNPEIDIAAQVVGGVAPAMATGGLSTGVQALNIGSKIATPAMKLAGKPLAALAQMAPKGKVAQAGVYAAKTAKGAIEGATAAVSQEAVRQGLLKTSGFMKPEEGPNLDEVSVAGAAIPLVGRGVGAAAKMAKVVGKGAMSAGLGVRPEAIDAYLNNYEKIQKARPLEEIVEASKQNISKLNQMAKNTEANLVSDVVDHLDILKNRITQSSRESFDILDAAGKNFSTQELLGAIEANKRNLLTGDKALIGQANKTAYLKLEQLQNDIAALGPEVPGATVKEVLQALDKDFVELSKGEFADAAAVSVNKSRKAIDEILKKAVPEYGEKMKEVAGLTDLHSRVFKEFGGSEKKAFSGIKAALDQKNPVRMNLLDEFAGTSPIALEQAKQGREAAEALNLLSDSNIGEKLSQFVKGNNNPGLREQLGQLSKLSDQELIGELQALRANEPFNREFLRGSRNVNMWTVIANAANPVKAAIGMSVAGAGTGMSPSMMAIGAAIGGFNDVYGPKMARQILNGVMAVKGIPTVQKIRALDVSEEAKRILIQDLARAIRPIATTDKDEERAKYAFYAPEEAKPLIVSEIRRSTGLLPEEKAKMIDEIRKTGKVMDFDKVVFAHEEPSMAKQNLTTKKKNKASPPGLEDVKNYFEYKKRQDF